MKVYVSILAFMFFSASAFAQTTLVLQPGAEGKDSGIPSYYPTTNYGTTNQLNAMAWTIAGDPSNARTLIDFDLSSLPSNAIITSATLNLFFNPDASSIYQNSGKNAMWIETITSSWNESTVTWNTKPTVTTTNRVSVPASTSATQNYTINVTQLLKDKIANPASNHGWMMSLQAEDPYASVMLASSDHSNAALHPKLVITYILPLSSNCISFKPGAEGKDSGIPSYYPTTNYGTTNQLNAMAWTIAGDPSNARTLIDFDLTSLPSDVVITSAKLNLYFNPDASSIYQNSGKNAMWIEGITSSWNESTVTWNTQPTVTTVNRVSVPASISATQNYEINITQLLKDKIANPSTNYGWMMSLQDEDPYASVMLASSDHSNAALHPKLEVCYTATVTTGIINAHKMVSSNVYPNPFTTSATIELNDPVSSQDAVISIYDLTGTEVQTKSIILSGSNSFNLEKGNLKEGLYFYTIKSGSQVVSTGKFNVSN